MSETQIVYPDAHIGSPLYLRTSKTGEPIENISFRNKETGSLGFSLVKSGLFPFHSIFESVKVQEDDERYQLKGLVYSLEDDHLVLRWDSYPENLTDEKGNPLSEVSTLRLHGLSNKRDKKIDSWVSFQNSWKSPFKLLVGERLDLFFQVYDKDKNPVYLTSNTRTFFVESRSIIRDLNAFWQYQSKEPFGFPSDATEEISANINVEAVLQEGELFLTWNSIYFSEFSIARYKLEYSINDGPVQEVILNEPDSVSYSFGKIFDRYPAKLKAQITLEYREYTTNDFFWVRPKGSRIEVHQETELVDISTQGSYWMPTPPDALRLVHQTLQDGPSNIIRECNSLAYHLAKGVERLKSKNSLVQELSGLPLRRFEKISELNNPHFIRAVNRIKGIPDYVTEIVKEPEVNLKITSTKPFVITVEDPIPPSFDPIKYADKLIDSLPISVTPIIIQNGEIPCTFTLDKKVDPKDGSLGIWSDCLGYKYEERVIIWITHRSKYEVKVEIDNVWMGTDSWRTIPVSIPWQVCWDENFILSERDPAGRVIVIQTRLSDMEVEIWKTFKVKNTNIKTRRYQLDLSWSGLLNGEALTPQKRAGEIHGFTGYRIGRDPDKHKFSNGLKFNELYSHEVPLLVDDQYHWDIYHVDTKVDPKAIHEYSAWEYGRGWEVDVLETTGGFAYGMFTNYTTDMYVELPAFWVGEWDGDSWEFKEYEPLIHGVNQVSETIRLEAGKEVVVSTKTNRYQTVRPKPNMLPYQP